MHTSAKKVYEFSGGWIGARYIYRELLFPFLFSIAVVTFVLLTNFLLKSIDRLLGKGLPVMVVIEFIYLNMAWIVAMSIPMAILVACVMAYGRLAEDNEITAMRASGISFISILIPGIIFGVIVAVFMVYFHNNVLPKSNYKAKLLYRDIYRKRPDLNIEPGYFMDDLPEYSIYVKEKNGDILKDITIYNKDPREVQTTIYADSGFIQVEGTKVRFTLLHGEIHELDLKNTEEYRRNNFERHIITLSVDDLLLERSSETRRGDREMNIAMLHEKVVQFQGERQRVLDKIRELVQTELGQDTGTNFKALADIVEHRKSVNQETLSTSAARVENRKLDILLSRVKGELTLLNTYQKQISRYWVEINKKLSIPFACIVFVLVGAPLGVMTRHGGIVVAILSSFLCFLLYYVFLIGGEELADLAIIPPFWAMWSSNILLTIVGIYLIHYTVQEQRSINFSALIARIRKEKPGNDRICKGKKV